MNAAVCGVPMGTIREIKNGEEKVFNDFGIEWGELHLSRGDKVPGDGKTGRRTLK